MSISAMLKLAPAVGLALALAAPQALAQDKTIELKLSHWVPPTHPLQKAMEEWGASIEKASGGTIKYKIFPSQQLGKAFDHYDMARDGIADLTYVNPGYQPGRFPIIAAGELPFLVGDAKGGIRAIDAWYRKYAGKEMKDVKYCFSFILDPLDQQQGTVGLDLAAPNAARLERLLHHDLDGGEAFRAALEKAHRMAFLLRGPKTWTYGRHGH